MIRYAGGFGETVTRNPPFDTIDDGFNK